MFLWHISYALAAGTPLQDKENDSLVLENLEKFETVVALQSK